MLVRSFYNHFWSFAHEECHNFADFHLKFFKYMKNITNLMVLHKLFVFSRFSDSPTDFCAFSIAHPRKSIFTPTTTTISIDKPSRFTEILENDWNIQLSASKQIVPQDVFEFRIISSINRSLGVVSDQLHAHSQTWFAGMRASVSKLVSRKSHVHDSWMNCCCTSARQLVAFSWFWMGDLKALKYFDGLKEREVWFIIIFFIIHFVD